MTTIILHIVVTYIASCFFLMPLRYISYINFPFLFLYFRFIIKTLSDLCIPLHGEIHRLSMLSISYVIKTISNNWKAVEWTNDKADVSRSLRLWLWFLRVQKMHHEMFNIKIKSFLLHLNQFPVSFSNSKHDYYYCIDRFL